MEKENLSKIQIQDKTFEIVQNQGFCDGCYYLDKLTCPPRALRICIWKGCILKEIKTNNK